MRDIGNLSCTPFIDFFKIFVIFCVNSLVVGLLLLLCLRALPLFSLKKKKFRLLLVLCTRALLLISF